MVATATKTFKDLALPVHECLNLKVVLENLGLAPGEAISRVYDFLLEDSFAITDLQVTKIIKDLAAGEAGAPNLEPAYLNVSVNQVPAGTDAEVVTDTQLAVATLQASLTANLEKGKKTVAGETFSATAGKESQILMESTALDPVLEVSPNGAASASGLTRKRIRVIVFFQETQVTTPGVAQDSASCMICMKFSKSRKALESLGEINFV